MAGGGLRGYCRSRIRDGKFAVDREYGENRELVMGGLGSGKWRKLDRRTVDSCPALDANYLSVRGYLQPGRSSIRPFSLGNGPNSEVILIDLRAEVDHLCLSWRSANISNNGSSGGSLGEQREGVIGIIPIAYKPCGFVGNRAYFVCSGGLRRIGSQTDDAGVNAAAAGGGAGGGAGVVCRRCVTKLYFSQPIYG